MVPMKLFEAKRLPKVGGFVTEPANQRESRIEVGGGDADAGALGGHQTLGFAQIGSPAQEIRGHANRDFGRRGRNVSDAEFRQEIVNRHAQEHAQLVVRLPQPDFQLFLEREGVVKVRAHLSLIDLAAHSALKAILRLLGKLSLHGNVAVYVFDLLLVNADLHVGSRHFRNQQDQCVVVVFNRGIEFGVGGFHTAAESAPEIEFPRQVGAHRHVIEEPIADRSPEEFSVHWIGDIRAQLIMGIVGRELLGLRKEIADGDVALCPGSEDPRAGTAQGQVLLVGLFDEPVKLRDH